MMNLLFEYAASDYRAVIQSERPRIVREIEHHLRNTGVCSPAVYVLSQNTKAIKGENNTHFYLQRYNLQWGCFVNLDSAEDIEESDKLTVAKIPNKVCPTDSPESAKATTEDLSNVSAVAKSTHI